MKSLSRTQALAVKAMAKRQLALWPETRFTITNGSTYTDHPACGGTNKLFINQNTAMSLADLGLAVLGDGPDGKIWLSPGALQLVRIGREMR